MRAVGGGKGRGQRSAGGDAANPPPWEPAGRRASPCSYANACQLVPVLFWSLGWVLRVPTRPLRRLGAAGSGPHLVVAPSSMSGVSASLQLGYSNSGTRVFFSRGCHHPSTLEIEIAMPSLWDAQALCGCMGVTGRWRWPSTPAAHRFDLLRGRAASRVSEAANTCWQFWHFSDSLIEE